MIKTALISLAVLMFSGVAALSLRAQDITALLRQAQSFEKIFMDEEALKKYKEILRYDPLHMDALCKASELYSIIGKRQVTIDKQKEYYTLARDYASKALKINTSHSEANFVMAVSLGRIALISSGEEKLKAVRKVKHFADKCIQLDPANYKGYHLLGKWHFEVSDLNAIERWLVKVTYGSLPKASINDAVKNYEISRQLNPSFLLNYLELAKAYKRKDEIKKAKALLEQMQKMPPSTSDDFKIKSLGRKMLDEL